MASRMCTAPHFLQGVPRAYRRNYSLSMSDLLRNNPDAATAGPGSNLTQLPCYPPGRTFQAGYYGSDVAFGQARRRERGRAA